MTEICIHGYVSGRVQGVWFRASTQNKALSLNITGWVKNLPDGRVELMACGEQADIIRFQDWLRVGPPNAQVDDLLIESIDRQLFTGFDVL